MECMCENSETPARKKEIFSEMAELLARDGLLTKEEKNDIKNRIWQEK